MGKIERSTFSGFLSIFSTKVVALVVGLASTPILVRLLTKEQYGHYAFVMSIFGLYMIVISGGIGDGVRKYVAEDREAENWEQSVIGFYFRAAFLVATVGAIGLIIIGYLGSKTWFDPEFQIYFYVLALLVFAAQYRNFNRRVLMGLGLERYSEPLKVINKVLVVGVGLLLVYLGLGVLGMLIGYVVASSLTFLIGLYYIHREISVRSFLAKAGSHLPKRELIMFNSWSIVLLLLLSSLYHVDVLMLKPIAGSVETSSYKAALTLAEFLWFVPLTIQAVLLHSTSELWSNDRHDAITELSTQVTRYTLLLTALFTIGLFVLAPVVVPLYLSEKYTTAVLPLRILLPGTLAFAVARPIMAIGQGKGDLPILVGGVGAAAGINFGLNFVLIPRFGQVGAAVATGIGYGSMFVFMVFAALRLGYNPLEDFRGLRVLLTILLSSAGIYGLNTIIGGGLPSLLIVPPVGFLMFTACSFLTGALDVAECRVISDKLPDPFGPAVAKVLDLLDWLSEKTDTEVSSVRYEDAKADGAGATYATLVEEELEKDSEGKS